MNQSNLITPIIAIALSPRIPGRVRSQAFYTAGDIIRGNKANQDLFSKTLVVTSSSGVTILSELPGKRSSNRQSSMSMLNGSNGAINGIPKPAVVAVVKSALSKDDFSNRSGAVYALQVGFEYKFGQKGFLKHIRLLVLYL